MGEQQSQKRGVVSEAQKTTTARKGYQPIPPANPVAGAHGNDYKDHQNSQTDEELALSKNESMTKTARERR
jgi:hypothetical protein